MVFYVFSEDSLWGKIQRLMLQGCGHKEISKRLSIEEWKTKRHMAFLRNSVKKELYKINKSQMGKRENDTQ